MAFTAFKTWVVGAVLPAAELNTYVRDNGNAMVPVGVIEAWPSTGAPTSWLLCQGQAVSRTTYSALFAVLSTTYGSTDANTFQVPDLRGRVIAMVDGGAGRMTASNTLAAGAGEENHTLSSAEMPVHLHGISHAAAIALESGTSTTANLTLGGGAWVKQWAEQTDNAGSGGAHNTKPPYLVLNYIIFAGV